MFNQICYSVNSFMRRRVTNMAQKKILITYFENYGPMTTNKTCIAFIEELKKSLGNNKEFCEFISLQTYCIPTLLTNCSLQTLLKNLANENFEYIISIGKSFGKKCFLERYDCICDCYALNRNILSKNIFKTKLGPCPFEMGACYKLRNILLMNYKINPKHPKFEFIHIGGWLPSKKVENATEEIANQINNLLK